MTPIDFGADSLEQQLQQQGYSSIAGVDEVGRGCLAGPVVAAAVILPSYHSIIGLNDSKKLTARRRETLFESITLHATSVGIGIINQRYIDQYNILQATFQAMKKALRRLPVSPDYVLVDGNKIVPGLCITQQAIIGGDSKIGSIAAASIIAKVTRDRIMDKIHPIFPDYSFNLNKGYGTVAHIQAIHRHGLSILHRTSFNTSIQMKMF